MENIRFNLSQILDKVNDKIKNPHQRVELLIGIDGTLNTKVGEITYYFEPLKLQMVLDKNDFNNYFEDSTEELISELLSRHIVNQLSASSGKKAFPEIKTLKSDLNQH